MEAVRLEGKHIISKVGGGGGKTLTLIYMNYTKKNYGILQKKTYPPTTRPA
jgi:hypothetical protein